jgi:hypothetical protein
LNIITSIAGTLVGIFLIIVLWPTIDGFLTAHGVHSDALMNSALRACAVLCDISVKVLDEMTTRLQGVHV